MTVEIPSVVQQAYARYLKEQGLTALPSCHYTLRDEKHPRGMLPDHFAELSRHEDVVLWCEKLPDGGVLQFCVDCSHELKGQCVPLPVMPSERTFE